MNKILITGGAGFIGSHVADVLLEAGYEVRVLDFLGAPTHDGAVPPWLNKKAEFLTGDVRVKDDWKRALVGVDRVVHLAAYMDYHLDFGNYVRTNIESLAFLFECIVEDKLPIKKIIIASSQSVYGVGKYLCSAHGNVYPSPRTEAQLKQHIWEHVCESCGQTMRPVEEKEDDILKPEIPYGITKLASEHLLFNLGKRYGIPSVALRFSIAVGPRQSFRHFYSGALRAFAVNVLSNEPIAMNEDGGQLRDFVDVRDVARAHRVVLEDDRANFQAFNVGSGMPTRVIDLARIVSDVAHRPFDPLLSDRYRVGDSRHSIMNIDKLESVGWSPTYALQQSVADYLSWLKQFGDLSDILKKTYETMYKEGILKQE